MQKIKRLVCLLMCFLTVMSFCSCGKTGESASYLMDKNKNTISVSADANNKNLYFCGKSRKQLEKICQSGMLEMYFDKDTYSISIYDSSSNALCRSLPKVSTGEKAAMIYADVIIDGNRYTLDSQSDSVAFSSALYEVGDNSVTVNYSIKRTLDKGVKISLNIPVVYSLNQGVFTVEVDCKNLVGEETSKNVVLESISVLPFFASSQSAAKGDFILLPDGCGTVIDLAQTPKSFADIKLDVYGANASLDAENQSVPVGAFGMKNTAAFFCLIEQGDSVAQIKAEKALKNGGSNQVYASFTITPALDSDNGVYVSEFSYKDKIKLSYRFLSRDADYITMAGVCREMLIRSGMLSGLGIEDDEAYHFYLGVDFAENESIVTDVSQCEEILSSLKAKGVGNINLIAEDLAAVKDKTLRVNSSLGSEKKYKEFLSLLKADSVKIYADVSAYSPIDENNALNIKGEEVDGVVSSKYFEENANALLYALKSSDFDGAFINDAGKMLYTDFDASCQSGEWQRVNEVSRLLAALTSFEDAAVLGGNIYALKYADSVVGLPDASSVSHKICKSVPFIQAVLHGDVKYTTGAINLKKDGVKAMLKCIEYGALPYYRWHYSDFSDDESKDSLYYMNSVNQAQLLYRNAKTLFDGLQDERITAHKQISKNLYMTQYGDTTKIYVNYGKEPVSVDGVTVDANSFLRVN